MVAIINPYKASHRTLAPLDTELSHNITSLPYLEWLSTTQYYKIEYIRKSETAWLLFVRPMDIDTKERFVLKILCRYKDTRYNLETVDERQKCQLEALQWNRTFTPDVYIGLARISDWYKHQKKIGIDEIITDPTREMLVRGADYALVMHQLPMDRRLDYLLNKESKASLRHYVQLLTKRLVQIHETLAPLSIEDGSQWGNFEQLQQKLEHNFALADPVVTASKNHRYSTSNWREAPLDCLKDTLLQVLPNAQYHHSSNLLKRTFNLLKAALFQVFTRSQYQEYFMQRVQEQRIKRCHGDLKAPNILIAPCNPSCDRELEKHIWILDAVDFNPMYCNIDLLSDLAMLVIDIQVRTKSSWLADLMIEDYLGLAGQGDVASKSVLAYYLVEKAFVGAAISMAYDNLPGLGWAFLEVAEMRMKDLKRLVGM